MSLIPKDITTKADLQQLMEVFYSKALIDEEIGYLFTEVAQLNIEKHLPLIVDFWQNNLLESTGYKRNVLQLHLDLHAQSALKPAHFERWLYLFEQTVDELFVGATAQKAKNRAASIATVMQTKIASQGDGSPKLL